MGGAARRRRKTILPYLLNNLGRAAVRRLSFSRRSSPHQRMDKWTDAWMDEWRNFTSRCRLARRVEHSRGLYSLEICARGKKANEGSAAESRSSGLGYLTFVCRSLLLFPRGMGVHAALALAAPKAEGRKYFTPIIRGWMKGRLGSSFWIQKRQGRMGYFV